MNNNGDKNHLFSYVRQQIIDKKKFRNDKKKYISLCEDDEIFVYLKENEFPLLSEYRTDAANLDAHYFLQDIWFAKRIIKNKPIVHYDIGSRVDGFLSHLLSANINVNMIDIRPLGIELEGLSFTQGDATDLKNIKSDSIHSLSSLHVVEHFGLGRYGDPIDPDGWKKGLLAMQRIVEPGGYFYLGVPISNKNTLCFNAHRKFEYHEVTKVLDKMKLIETAYISNYSVINVPIDKFEKTNISDDYACGLYVFNKDL